MARPKKLTGVLFPVQGEPVEVTIPAGLEPLQALVAGGGYVQALPDLEESHGLSVWLDEDGKAKRLQHNQRAERAYRDLGGKLFHGDYLAGPVLFLGAVDDNGDTQSLTPGRLKSW